MVGISRGLEIIPMSSDDFTKAATAVVNIQLFKCMDTECPGYDELVDCPRGRDGMIACTRLALIEESKEEKTTSDTG
jgi:hypothetical protein